MTSIQNSSTENRDLLFEEFTKHQFESVTPAFLESKAQTIQLGNKFSYYKNEWQCIPYPGIGILSVIGEQENGSVYEEELTTLQRHLCGEIDLHNKIYALPPESFHQTLVNTFSDKRLEEHIISRGILHDFPHMLEKALNNNYTSTKPNGINVEVIGVTLLSTAVVAVLHIPYLVDYNAILNLRKSIYNDTALSEVNISLTRAFIGHISFGYIEQALTIEEKTHLVRSCLEVNENLKINPIRFKFTNFSIYSYQDLSAFEQYSPIPYYNF